MGVVFEAEQRHLGRRVALKMIKPEKAGDPLAGNCFFYEAAITAGLEHPGIIPILEFSVTRDGRAFYTMKKAAGKPWHRIIRKRSLAENLSILDRVADVIAYAHSRGVIHRDLKPANILLGDFGEVWVGDWGVALRRNAGGDYAHAHPGGTPQYMPPEMARGDNARLGPASDIYLLGAMLYEIVAGGPPHPGDGVLETLENAADNAVRPTNRKDRLLPIARRAMAGYPEERHATASEFKQAIKNCLSESEGRMLLDRAGAQLAEAKRLGGYDRYRQALADYDSALATDPGSVRIRRERSAAVLAYGRQALSNNEFDLALSIVRPEGGAEAKNLAGGILKARAAAERLRRRRSVVNAVLGLMVVALLLTGAYVARNRYEIMAGMRHPSSVEENAGKVMRLKGSFVSLKVQALSAMRKSAYHSPKNPRKRRKTSDPPTAAQLPAAAAIQPPLKELHDLYAAMLPVLDSCLSSFDEEPWQSPARINRVCLYLRSRVPELEECIRRIRALRDGIPQGSAGDRLRADIDGISGRFANLTYLVYRIPVFGE
ncbi:MAG: serine/threonine protein kinase [Planctomycetota bacterium]|jgi:tetratricopeptide (TPR) repeat protein|nr:serine/threonine protein kinase [Planctomycetota bacterium]